VAFLENVWQDTPAGEVAEPFDYRATLNTDSPNDLRRRMQENDA
jgi:hypothetical protein